MKILQNHHASRRPWPKRHTEACTLWRAFFAKWLLRAALVASVMVQAACTTTRAPSVPGFVPEFAHDAVFGEPLAAASLQDLFALSPAMQVYAQQHLSALQGQDRRSALLAALYRSGSLQLRYDDARTRTAAQAFEDRAGNCLSLVLMTAAFAKHLGLEVSYQAVAVDPVYARRGLLQTSSGHVNLVLRKRALVGWRSTPEDADLTVDFLPGVAVARTSSQVLEERTLLAMYNNNRAAEHLEAGRTPEAYWSARAALVADPRFASALNTLGVVYLRSDLNPQAQQVFESVLLAEPANLAALSNLQQAFRKQGLVVQAEKTAARLARLQPQMPFDAFDKGQEALKAGDLTAAQRYFDQELRLQPQQHEVHYWAAVTSWRLGHTAAALAHLRHAQRFSPNPNESQRYLAKLESLRSAPE